MHYAELDISFSPSTPPGCKDSANRLPSARLLSDRRGRKVVSFDFLKSLKAMSASSLQEVGQQKQAVWDECTVLGDCGI